MSKVIMGVLLKERQETAPDFQEILTRYGCIIKTRLGVHAVAEDSCTMQGLIILELMDNKNEDIAALEKELSALHGAIVKKMEF